MDLSRYRDVPGARLGLSAIRRSAFMGRRALVLASRVSWWFTNKEKVVRQVQQQRRGALIAAFGTANAPESALLQRTHDARYND